MTPSIFNDVIGPVMRGPSSSHCAAALRIGRLARDVMRGDITDVLVEFDRGGSLPTTHESQGSDMGLFGGLLGWETADDRLPQSAAALQDAGIRIRIEIVDTHDPHPNTYRLTLRNARERHTLIAISTGGGMMEMTSLDGFPVSVTGGYFESLLGFATEAAARHAADVIRQGMEADEVRVLASPGLALVQVRAHGWIPDQVLAAVNHSGGDVSHVRLAPVLPVLSRRSATLPFSTAAGLVAHDAGRNRPLWQWAIDYERERGGLTDVEVMAKMVDIVKLLRRSVQQGIDGTTYDDRVLGHQSGRYQDYLRAGRLIDTGILNRAVLYVTALMEVKSAMGVIVAAPTAGACAALPGAVLAMADELRASDEDAARAMLAAGLIGVFIAGPWTFAAEVGGCQAEGGSAAAMAAAALVTLAEGDLTQGLGAASMALQAMLGLICDPVAGRVEVPCLGKNVLAASQAFSCANMALAGFDALIPFDEVVHAASRVADRMPREHRCTSLGGLADTPTARALEAKLCCGVKSC